MIGDGEESQNRFGGDAPEFSCGHAIQPIAEHTRVGLQAEFDVGVGSVWMTLEARKCRQGRGRLEESTAAKSNSRGGSPCSQGVVGSPVAPPCCVHSLSFPAAGALEGCRLLDPSHALPCPLALPWVQPVGIPCQDIRGAQGAVGTLPPPSHLSLGQF